MSAGIGFWPEFFNHATQTSFNLDGLLLSPDVLATALAPGGGKPFRSRQQQRARNHVAILKRIEQMLINGTVLKTGDAVRWYTSIASGLSIAQLDEGTHSRLETVVRQVNSPHLRLCPAVQGIAKLHQQILIDPVVPSFNGILARLLLQYHLGRCGLPPVVFVPEVDASVITDEQQLQARLLDRLDDSYAVLLGKSAE